MIKIAHFADTHIRNLKFHREYREVFGKIYDILRDEKPDYIVHCGDLAHTKTQLSPEYFDLASDFLKNLADIAPTIILPGNHDGNLKNSSRQDAITPIVKALEHKNLHLIKEAATISLDDEIEFNILSVFDEDNWKPITDKNKINIALYHGSVSGVITDTGYVMEHGDHDVSIFKGFDFALLGDIHKTNQSLDPTGRVRYPGSTVQQNHGETNDKGFLIWEIEDKDNFDVRHISVENPRPFITVDLTEKGKIPKGTVVPEGARLRLASNTNLPLQTLKRAMDIAKTKFKPESVTYVNRVNNARVSVEDLANSFEHEDLRDLDVQEKLIREYLKDYQVDKTTLDRVVDLNKKYNVIAEGEEEVGRNINWTLNGFAWNNLFNYSTGNKIDTRSLNGIVGIFGKNFSGKSSIIDSFLWTVHNSTSKNVRKNLNIINQNKEAGSGVASITIGNRDYYIERRAEKYIKKLRGEETEEAKTDVDFYYIDKVTGERVSQNGTSRQETDKNIRKLLGTLDDFLLTSMTSQLGSMVFINEGSTKRKEILAKFLDLDLFAKKSKLASDDASDLKGALKRLEQYDFDQEIKEAKFEVEQNENKTSEHKFKCDLLKQQISTVKDDIQKIDVEIASYPEFEVLDEQKALSRMDSLKLKKTETEEKLAGLLVDLKDKREFSKKVQQFLEDFDVEEVKNKKQIIVSKETELHKLLTELRENENKQKYQTEKTKLLEEVPCGNKFPHCKFLLDANEAKAEVKKTVDLIQILNKKKSFIEDEIVSLTPEKVEEHLEKYAALISKQKDNELDASNLQLKYEKNKSKVSDCEKQLEELQGQIDEYKKNESIAGIIKMHKETRKRFTSELKELEDEMEVCEEEVLELYRDHGSLEQKLENLQTKKEERETLRNDYMAYELYEKCMHSNGISYDIIKKRLPVINEEIAKVLANIVDFEIFFEDDGKKLDILIKHPKYEARPLELGSGAEKTLGAMAIRLALIKVSSLPVGDLFVLDEPATALDENNMEGFIRTVEMLKTQFKTVVLISHLDALKDIVDQQIVIDKTKEGFAHVEV